MVKVRDLNLALGKYIESWFGEKVPGMEVQLIASEGSVVFRYGQHYQASFRQEAGDYLFVFVADYKNNGTQEEVQGSLMESTQGDLLHLKRVRKTQDGLEATVWINNHKLPSKNLAEELTPFLDNIRDKVIKPVMLVFEKRRR